MGRPDYILGQFGKRVGGSKVNLLSPTIAIWFDCSLLAGLCCHLATENIMKLLFLAFRYVAAGGGVCCAPHHSLLIRDVKSL